MRFNKLFFLVSNRPEFCDLEKWLESLLLHLEVGLPLLSDMTFTLLPGTLMRKISETSDGDDQTYRKRDTSFRSAHRSLSWHQQSLRDTEIQKNLTFARFCVQITATTWFQSMLAAFVGNFCSRSCLGVWERNSFPAYSILSSRLPHGHLLMAQLQKNRNIFSVAEIPLKWKVPCKQFVRS